MQKSATGCSFKRNKGGKKKKKKKKLPWEMLVAKLQDAEPLSSCCGFTISFCPGEQNTSSKSCVHKKVHPTKEEHSGAGSLVTDPFSKAKQKRVECTHK